MMKREMKPADAFAKFRRQTIVRNVNRHLALYLKTGDGLLIWRAYQEYRRAGMPVPKNLLKKFDQFAERLGHAGSAKEVAAALEMRATKGGPAGATLTRGREYQRDIVEYVRNVLGAARAHSPPLRTADVVYKDAAKHFGTTKNYVEKTYRAWMRETGQGQKRVTRTREFE